MIKDTHEIKSGRWLTEAYCDSCHVKIFDCTNFDWNVDQVLIYSPLLCESCGKKHSQSIGEDQKKIQELETKLKWAHEKIQEVLDFCEGRVEKLSVRKEELLKRLETL